MSQIDNLKTANNDVKIVSLIDSDHFVEIVDETHTYYGGDQNWFDTKFARDSACGTVAGSNIFAYMSMHDSRYSSLYSFSDFSLKNYISHMNEVYKELYPRHVPFTSLPLGIWPLSKLVKGVVNHAKSRGLNLCAKHSNIGKRKGNNKEKTIDFIISGLEQNIPIALLIGLNKEMKSVNIKNPNGRVWKDDVQMHWVVVTKINIDKNTRKAIIKISTWGGYAYLDLDDLIDGEQLHGGFVYFEVL